jgi:uncharacterized protein YcbK (DUF882 family)
MQKAIWTGLIILALATPVSTAVSGLTQETQKALELAEVYYGTPIFVTSSYRTKEHNKAVGGVANSFHLKGEAVDIRMPNSATQLNRLIWALTLAGFTGVGVYNSHIHGDIRQKPIFWRG